MSSYWAGYSGTGLVLDQDEFNAFLDSYKEKNPLQAKDLDEYLSDEPLEEICFLKSLYAGEEIKDLQIGAEEKYPEKITYICELYSDSVQGLTLWPFYKKDGRLNVDVQRPDGSWEYEESHAPMLESMCDACYVIWSGRSFTDARVFERPAYNSYDEFVQEFKDSVGAYLPEDFDWDAHLGYLSYACYA